MDFMDALGRVVPVILAGMPRWIDDARKLVDALATHPDPSIRPGAAAISKAISEVEQAQPR